jgi:hypothetical protein
MRLTRAARASMLIAGLLFLVLAAGQASKPLHLDSSENVAMADALLHTGSLLYHRGIEWGLSVPWPLHPPLYFVTLAGWFGLVGTGAVQAHMLGALYALLGGGVAVGIGRTLVGRPRTLLAEVFFWPLYLLAPFTLQASAVVDIETQLYGPLLGLLLLTTLRIGWRDGTELGESPRRGESFVVASVLVLCLWTKLTTVWIVVPALVLFLPREWNLWRRVRWWLAVVTPATLVAVAGRSLFRSLTGMIEPVDASGLSAVLSGRRFAASALSFERAGEYLEHLQVSLRATVTWMGLLPWVAVAAVALVPVRALPFGDRIGQRLWRRLALLTIAVYLGYCAQTTPFASAPFKYVTPVWALAVLLLAVAASGLPSRPGPGLGPGVSNGILALLTFSGIVGFAITRWWLHDLAIGRLVDGFSPGGPEIALVLVPALAALPLFFPRPSPRGVAVAAMALLVASGGAQAGVATYQSRAPYSTTYNYGQRGIGQTAAYLRLAAPPSSGVACMKDLGLLLGRPYWDNHLAVNGDESDLDAFIERMRDGRIEFAVFTAGHGQDDPRFRPHLQDWLASECEVRASFGDYRVFTLALPH